MYLRWEYQIREMTLAEGTEGSFFKKKVFELFIEVGVESQKI